MSTLQIRLLGQLEISQSDALSQLRLSSACQKIMAYLLLHTGKMCRREVLMDVFWQDNSPERARSCLNSAVWRLRRELENCGLGGANYLLSVDSVEIGFNWECDYWLDVQTFEQSLSPTLRKPLADVRPEEAAQAERVLALYRGELLEGIYEDWALIERERLRTIYMNALMYLMNYYANCSAFDKSLEFAKAILTEDPLREDIHRNVMRLYVSVGQRALAVQHYRACAASLESELGIGPMEETQQLYRQILDSPAAQQTITFDAQPVHPDMEQHLRTIMRNLDQAHAHLKQAAHLLSRLVHLQGQYSE